MQSRPDWREGRHDNLTPSRNWRDSRQDDRRDWRNNRSDDRREWRDSRSNSRVVQNRWNNQRRWDRDWRNDRRYDWRDYRNSHRRIYRMPRYYRSEEHTSELQSLMRISYAVFCLKKKTI